MHDPKFEQKVQQKMEELNFTPSAAVWTRVEQAVNEKKRRRAPLFWWFLLPGLILTGAGLLYLNHTADHVVIAHPAVANPVPGGKDHPAPIVSTIPGTNNTPERVLTVPGAPTPAGAGPERRGKAETGAIVATNAPASGRGFGITNEAETTNKPATKREAAIQNGIGTKTKSGAGSTRAPSANPVPEITDVPGTRTTSVVKNVPGTKDNATAKNDAVGANTSVANSANNPTVMHAEHPVRSPRLAAVGPFSYNVQGRRLPVSKMSVPGMPVNLQHKHRWESGFTGGAGVSSLNENFIQKTVISANLRATTAMTPITSNAKNNYTSNVEPGVSYWAGIYMQRYLTPRLSLSVGLNLHYYTSRMKVGEKVDYTYSNASQSFLFISDSTANANAAAQLSAPYYTTGTDYNYTNRYFFLELPVVAQWRLNRRSAHIPLYWEGGVTLSRLISSNGLYYNLHSGVYQRDRTVFNKTQFNISTALLVGLPIKGIRLAVGPQLQYGLTNLLNTQTTGAEHLFYGGIKIVLTR